MHHWGHMLAVTAIVVALAAVLVARYHAHQRSVSDIYSSYIVNHRPPDIGDATGVDANTFFATEEQREALSAAAHEGVCHARGLYTTSNIWTVLLVVLLVAMLVYHYGSQRYFH
jgi:hypothetical protein